MKRLVYLIFGITLFLVLLNACNERSKTTSEINIEQGYKNVVIFKPKDTTHYVAINKAYLKHLGKLPTYDPDWLLHNQFPSYNSNSIIPPNTATFQLSQDYPTAICEEELPWLDIDFKTHPEDYLQSILDYCMEGNVDNTNSEQDFITKNNSLRNWYHAPWLHTGDHGREYRHGLTRELPAQPRILHPHQGKIAYSWAVGFYNCKGAKTIGDVWHAAQPNAYDRPPNPSNCVFPEGTVSFKLLFTTASETEVPYLQNSLKWTANIGDSEKDRTDQSVRLIQLDLAVKDQRSLESGWVFGTYIYNGSIGSSKYWENLTPVGLSWGNDSDIPDEINKEGSFANKALTQNYLNPDLLSMDNANLSRAFLTHAGLGGRVNGPLDNPISSCMSCHGQASTYVGNNPKYFGKMLPMRMKGNISSVQIDIPDSYNDFEYYFRDISGGNHIEAHPEAADAPYQHLDYSLQLAAGISNYHEYVQNNNSKLFQDAGIIDPFPRVSKSGH